MNVFKKLVHTVLSISGFVPENMTLLRSFFMLGSVLLTVFVLPEFLHINYAIVYFVCSTVFYLGFIFLVLPQDGLRLRLIEKFGEEEAYLYYEGFLAFAFFHNGASLTFISQSSLGTGFFEDVPPAITMAIVVILFVVGLVVKIWSAYVVGIPIYYWKDMFLGRKVSDFVVTGPYKYFSNPMYGIGQLQVYGIAIYYNSSYGLIFGTINQALVFLFYFAAERPFIYRTYIATGKQ
ncbi:MAG TPA: methyltransferase [Cyclobacteriaceae bacterium]|nr:methyltransferase [Cyclobacteriaceae bacterium]